MADQQVVRKVGNRFAWVAIAGLVITTAGLAVAMAANRSGATPEATATGRASGEDMLMPRDPIVDLSGFGLLGYTMKMWSDRGTQEEVAEAFRGAAARTIEGIDRQLGVRNPPVGERVQVYAMKALAWNSEGRPKEAYATVAEARKLAEADPETRKAHLATLMYLQGVISIRLGENENCIECRGDSSCILPIAGSAVHINPRGSRQAIGHFTEYLEHFPDDLEAKWLLNLAHMTLGEYPAKVAKRHLVPLEGWLEPEATLGKFRDIGHLVGVNRFTQAGGTVMDDFDNDGLLDLAVTSFDPLEPATLYRNAGDGTFEDRGVASGLEAQRGGLVCYQADYDNDGDLDLFIGRGAWYPRPMKPSLMRNNGDGTFTDVTEPAGMVQTFNTNSACWGDYDNDGLVDLFVACEAQPNLLYHNKGDGTFEEVGDRAMLRGYGRTFAKGSNWIDFDNDDYPDLYVNFLLSPAALYRNNRDGTFSEVTSEMGIAGPEHGFSCWVWDYDNDGWLDIFATSYDRTLEDIVLGLTGQDHKREKNKLYRNLGGKGFEEVAEAAGLGACFATMGSNFGDLDNDGFLDFYLGTGEPNIATLVPNRMFKNIGGKRFAEVTGSSGTGHLQKGHGIAFGDWDRDGDLDIYEEMGGAINGDKYHNLLFQNPGHGNRWLNVKLVGEKTNRSALGARIKVVTAGEEPLTVHRQITSGSSFGGNSLEQVIGIGKADQVALLEIHWPTSGTTQVFRDLAADQAVEVSEFAEDVRVREYRKIEIPTE